MCASSSVRCGSCLAKWSGKLWEESYKCVLSLKSWSVVLNKKFQLCVEGYCDMDINLAVCIPITERLNSYWVSNDYTLVKLRGVLKTGNLPEYVAQRFSRGIPTDWKDVASKWAAFVQKGDKSSFCWQNDESFDSNDTTFLFAASRRFSAGGREIHGKSKEKSFQRTLSSTQVNESERDSAVPTTDFSSPRDSDVISAQLPGDSPSPWLPAHKVKEINRWIRGAHIPAEPPDSDMDVESRGRNFLTENTAVSNVLETSKNRVQNLEAEHPKLNSRILQSALLNSSQESRMPSSFPNDSMMTRSTFHSFALDVCQNPKTPRGRAQKNSAKTDPKILQSETQIAQSTEEPCSSNNSSLTYSEGNSAADLFCKPKNSTKDCPPKNAAKTAKVIQSRTLPQPLSKNSEVPGSLMGRMLSSSLRPRRKQSMKIERWRPVLGVDGSLKVQGYLLLQCDMTAGQILTTNSVIEWGNRKVVTCDKREYVLVGDPFGKIPDGLKKHLLAPMKCGDIVMHLRESQALKDRSDWGAEYEYFYEDDKPHDASTSSQSKRLRNGITATSRTTPSSKQKTRAAAQAVNSQNTTTCVMVSPASNQSTDSVEEDVSVGSKTLTKHDFENSAPIQNHPSKAVSSSLVQTSSQMTKQQMLSKPQSSGSSRKIFRSGLTTNSNSLSSPDRSGLTTNSSSLSSVDNRRESAVVNNHLQELNQNIQNNRSAESARSCFENITWKNSQNHMMMPSPILCRDSSAVDFSSSRIKVSYITPSPKSVQTLTSSNSNQKQTPSTNQQLATRESITSEEITPKTRPSRSPVKRSCLPCCQLVFSPSRSSPHSHVPHKSLPNRTMKRVVSQSPVGKRRSGRVVSSPPASAKTTTRTTSADSVRTRALSQSLRLANKQTASASSAVSPRSSSARKPLTRGTSKKLTSRLCVVLQRVDVEEQLQNQQKKSKPVRRQEKSVSLKEKPLSKEGKGKPLKGSKKGNKYQKKKKQTVTKGKAAIDKRVAAGKRREVLKKKQHQTEESASDSDSETSKCSSSSSISVGPSASVIFAMHDSPPARRAPRTLKERRERDAKLTEMGKHLAAKEPSLLDVDDDPLANLIATQKNLVLPEEAQEWCNHENFLRQNRKRRRPSSSEGTVSPSRSGCDDGCYNEDATSSVATPQLLMRPHDPNKVQSYLQRQRALNAKPQRPTRQVKRDKNLVLPHIDYASVFRPDKSDSEESERTDNAESDPDWK